MAPPERLFVVAMVAAAALFLAAPRAGAQAFEDPDRAAEVIGSVFESAKLRKTPGKPEVMLLWQGKERPGNLDALMQKISRSLSRHNISVIEKGLPTHPPYQGLRLDWPGNVVGVIALGLQADALRILSDLSRTAGVLTIGSDDDMDPLSVGLSLKGAKNYSIYCSDAALEAEKVSLKDKKKLCRDLPKSRAAIVDSVLWVTYGGNIWVEYDKAHKLIEATWNKYVPSKNTTVADRPMTDPERKKINDAARVLQKDLGFKREEGELPEAKGDRPKIPYLPHYELGRAFYLNGNCEAARLELMQCNLSLDAYKPSEAPTKYRGRYEIRLQLLEKLKNPQCGARAPAAVTAMTDSR